MNLNLGSGILGADSFWSGDDWLNIDVHANDQGDGYDWTKAKYLRHDMEHIPWPIESDSMDCVWASHILEHFSYFKLLHVLLECYRVMKADAPMRIVCPDPRKFIANFQMGNKQYILDCLGQDNWDRWDYNNHPNIGFTDMFFPDHIAHSLCSSIDYVSIVLIRIGFKKVNEMTYGNTAFPQFFGSLEKTMDNRPSLSWFLEVIK